mmetsp:Transcript_10482/g.15900  ORF Transcript_10482/g.15900 Transcript_10482/m.15900 type:complete len:124 (-) Transcript_10482:960-1331(-)
MYATLPYPNPRHLCHFMPAVHATSCTQFIMAFSYSNYLLLPGIHNGAANLQSPLHVVDDTQVFQVITVRVNHIRCKRPEADNKHTLQKDDEALQDIQSNILILAPSCSVCSINGEERQVQSRK